MTDEKQPDLQTSLSEAWEQILALEETINDLVLQVSAIQVALVKTLPSFALEYERAYNDGVLEQERHENELPPNVREEFRRLRRKRT